MISDVVSRMSEAFTLYGCPAPVLFGEKFLGEHFDGSRVVVVPSVDTFGNKKASYAASPGFQKLRPIGTRSYGATASIFGAAPVVEDASNQLAADYAVTDALINMVTISLNQITEGIYTIQGGEFVTGQVSQVSRGLLYVMQFSVDVPLVDTPWPNVALSACDQTFIPESVSGDVTIKDETSNAEMNFPVA